MDSQEDVKINVLDNIKNAIKCLDENEEYLNELFNLQSTVDKKIDYWLHYIELENIKVTQAYKIIKEIQKLRNQRRNYKNQLEIMRVFRDNESKLCNSSNRSILLNTICKTSKKQSNATYGYRAYTSEEKNKILGITERKYYDN